LSGIFYWGFIAKARLIKSLAVCLNSISSPFFIPGNQAGSIYFSKLSLALSYLIIARTLWEVHVLGPTILDVCGEKPSLYEKGIESTEVRYSSGFLLSEVQGFSWKPLAC